MCGSVCCFCFAYTIILLFIIILSIIVLIFCVPILTIIGYLVYALFIAISPFLIIYYYFFVIDVYLRIGFGCRRRRNFKYLPSNQMLKDRNIINLQWEKSLFLKQT
jgi:hypothetical protein